MRTIFEVSVTNFLSFKKATVTLNALSVLVGPNGTGKTNFLKVFQFLGEVARRDLGPAVDEFGGIQNMLFRGSPQHPMIQISLNGLITEHSSQTAPDEYSLEFRQTPARGPTSEHRRNLIVRTEKIVFKRIRGRGRRITLTGRKVQSQADKPQAKSPTNLNTQAASANLNIQAASSGLNMLRKLGDEYGAPQVESLAQVFESLRLFEVDVEQVRTPASLEDPERLADNASNLAAYLYWLSKEHKILFEQVCDDVRFVLPSFQEFRFTKLGGSNESIRVDFKENHLIDFTPLARASFGTIRAIALFAMLSDPSPPRLTCLEEVDHGLHPHAIDRLVERLRDASARTQIIVATHSPVFVNRIRQDEIVIFERNSKDGSTIVVDLSPGQIKEMMSVSGYQLGELWFSGTLGGALD